MAGDLRQLAQRYFIEIMNMNRKESFNEIFAPDFKFTLPTHPEPYIGPEGMQELVNMLHGAFPDFYINVADMVVGDDTVVCRWRGGGTHTGGPLVTTKGDLEANGKFFEIDGMSWLRMREGKVIETIGHEDTVGLLMQLGYIPVPEPEPQPVAEPVAAAATDAPADEAAPAPVAEAEAEATPETPSV